MLILPTAPTAARPALDQLRSQRVHCTMFVFGDGEARRQLASDAEVRAENHPFRKVAWVPDPVVIDGVSGYQALRDAHSNGAIIATATLDFRVSSTLGDADTMDFVAIERAFIKAEAGL